MPRSKSSMLSIRQLNFLVMLVLTVLAFVMMGCVDADKVEIVEEATGHSLTESLAEFNNKALFLMGDIYPTEIISNHTMDHKWEMPNNIQLVLKVCGIGDQVSGGHLNGHKFTIDSELGLHSPVMVTNNCVTWGETVPYNYFATSKHLVVHFKFKSLNGVGTVVKRWAWNPWDRTRNDSGFSGALDITNLSESDWPKGTYVYGRQKIIKALNGDLHTEGDEQAQLIAKNFTIDPQVKEGIDSEEAKRRRAALSPKDRVIQDRVDKYLAQKKGLHIELGLEMNAAVSVKDSTGIPHVIDLKSGRFKVFMQLLATGQGGDGKRYILNHMAPSPGCVWQINQNGKLIANLPMVLKKQSTYGNLALALKIVPIDVSGKIKPLSAIYNLGRYSKLMNRQSPTVKKDGLNIYNSEAYNKYISAAENYNEAKHGLNDDKIMAEIATMRDSVLFYFTKLNIRFVRILPGETATDRTIQYRVESCLLDGFDGSNVKAGLQFDIKTYDSGESLTGKELELRKTKTPRDHARIMRRETDEKRLFDLVWSSVP